MRWLKKVFKVCFSVLAAFLLMRWVPIAGAAIASVVSDEVVRGYVSDPYVRAILCSLSAIAFLILMFNFGEIALAIITIACYGAITTWLTKYEQYRTT